jgi:hypothetical protein
MASTVEELKIKLAENEVKMAALRAEIEMLEDQRAAFRTVIAVYDPNFVKADAKRQLADRSTSARRVTDLLKGHDIRRGILETLRDMEQPILATDVSHHFLFRKGLEGSAKGLSPRLASRFSTVLHKLKKDGLVRG